MCLCSFWLWSLVCSLWKGSCVFGVILFQHLQSKHRLRALGLGEADSFLSSSIIPTKGTSASTAEFLHFDKHLINNTYWSLGIVKRRQKIMASFATSAITHPGGKFVRLAQGHREIISPEHEIFKPAPNRYHLYISYACPWANRCLAMLKLKGLTHTIGVTSVHPTWKKTKPDNDEDKHCGWAFFDSNNDPPYANTIGFGSFTISGCEPDPHNDAKFIRDLYELSDDKFNKYSVPVLWDIETKRIVNNESSEIIRMFNTQFTAYETGPFAGYDFYPDSLKDTIDEVNAWVYSDINDGVYKCGFSRSQIAYNEAATTLFTALDRVESILSHSRYIAGDVLTEADIRLFMTLVRYDEVYVVYFKCNGRSLLNMPNIRNYMREMYQLSSMNEAIRMDHIKMHYFTSHPTLNPYAIIPMGPDVLADLQKPHDRDETCPKTDGGVK